MKKLFCLTIISLILCLLNTEKLSAQEKLHYWSNSETFLQDQASIAFETAYRVLETHPPQRVINDERRLALLTLDVLLHDTRLDNGVAFRSIMNQITNNLITELKKPKPAYHETHFYRFYNHGFIIQTSTVTVGIDLVRGINADNSFISDTLMRSLVEQCDVLFITHAHRDHADLSVAQMFCEQGKQVIVPEEIWKNVDLPLRLMRGEEMIHETVHLQDSQISLSVRVYPGHQGEVLNNVYMITLPEGQTIMHTGDQDYTEDLAAQLNRSVKVDVLLVHCWMMPMEPLVSAINPALVICGHENEVGHTIDHREAYWLTFKRMKEVKAPYVIMAWGESYLLKDVHYR